MSDEEDYSSEDDLDYVPDAGEDLSEEEGSGDEEDLDALNEDAKKDGKVGGRKERRKKKNELGPRKRQGGIKLEGVDETNEQTENGETEERNMAEEIAKEKEAKKEENEKKKADSLWASFLSDVKPPPKKLHSVSPAQKCAPKVTSDTVKSSSAPDNPKSNSDAQGKMTITKVFDFAGEEVKITKEVDLSSKEAKEEIKKQKVEEEKTEESPSTMKPPILSNIGGKRPAQSSGGLGNLLSKIGKKPKMSVLEKSKMDWNSFKKEEGIEDDLKIHNRGKESYLERMAFLNRADVRQFEVEKSIRLGSSKR